MGKDSKASKGTRKASIVKPILKRSSNRKTNKSSRNVIFNPVTETDSGTEMETANIETERRISNSRKPSNKYLIQNIDFTSNKNREPYNISHFQSKHEKVTAMLEKKQEQGQNARWEIKYVDDGTKNRDWKITSIDEEQNRVTWCDIAGVCAYSALALAVGYNMTAGKTRRHKKRKTKRRY
jgi:hypothetical protein